jgi:hypothetical protein
MSKFSLFREGLTALGGEEALAENLTWEEIHELFRE